MDRKRCWMEICTTCKEPRTLKRQTVTSVPYLVGGRFGQLGRRHRANWQLQGTPYRTYRTATSSGTRRLSLALPNTTVLASPPPQLGAKCGRRITAAGERTCYPNLTSFPSETICTYRKSQDILGTVTRLPLQV